MNSHELPPVLIHAGKCGGTITTDELTSFGICRHCLKTGIIWVNRIVPAYGQCVVEAQFGCERIHLVKQRPKPVLGNPHFPVMARSTKPLLKLLKRSA